MSPLRELRPSAALSRHLPRLRPLLGGLIAAGLGAATLAAAQPAIPVQPPSGEDLQPVTPPGPLLVPDGRPDGPAVLLARRVQSDLGRETRAVGDVDLRRGGLWLTADQLRYLESSQLAFAEGHVVLSNNGDRFTGTQAVLQLDHRSGSVTEPTYFFGRTQAGGSARRIDFDSPERLHAVQASYSSCRPGDGQSPDWELRMDRLDLDFAQNEGHAEGAVLRFLGVPILAAPAMSFPATSDAKTGLLPPTINIDSRGGFELAQPYYWRLAPNYDLTLGPILSTRRDPALQGEFRYLGLQDAGQIGVHYLPWDRATEHRRYSVQAQHRGDDGQGLQYDLSWQDASDDRYWKDFSGMLPSLTPRLLSQAAGLSQRWDLDGGSLTAYARVQGWRTLQDADNPITVPYQRVPQLGLQLDAALPGGLELSLQGEANRFVLGDRAADDRRPDGDRVHLLASISRPYEAGWGWLTPRLALNAASYRLDTPLDDGRTHATRSIPTLSVDGGLRFERDVSWFGTGLMQTLEPRLHYVLTPWRNQTGLPAFDTAASDFNAVSIYQDNEFTGVDRVSDAHQITLGATTRFLDTANGVERLRLGAAQRFQFRDQHLTASGLPATKQASDLLLFASGRLTPAWTLDTTVQYNADANSSVRSIVSARYSPEPFHTLSGTYRYARSLNEQFELGMQWPLYRGSSSGSCGGTLYGVGRANYSLKDGKLTDSVAGVEYDAGCWILRVVNRRVSTGQSETTQRWMIQLELTGLSSLGSNPLQVLKDNIPGYRLLRDDDARPTSSANP